MKLHLTEKALAEIEIGERPNLKVFDSEVTGFGCQLTRSKSGSFFIFYRDGQGKNKQERIGRLGEMAADKARELARQTLLEINAKAKATVSARAGHCVSCSTFFHKTYLPHVKASGSNAETHASLWRNHLEQAIGELRLDEVTPERIHALREALLNKEVAGGRWKTQTGKKLSVGTVTRILILVRHLFNIAQQADVAGLTGNPTRGLNLAQNSQEVRGQFLSRDELKRLLEVARDKGDSMDDILIVMALTGLRRGNVLGMRWEWIDLERGTVCLPSNKVKSRKFTVKHLSAPVLELLQQRWCLAQQQLSESPDQFWRTQWVFPNPKTGMPYFSRRSLWVTIRKQAGLATICMHDLRHTFASMMLESGRSIMDVKEALGHTQLKTTLKYLHLTERRRRESEDCTANYIGLSF